MRITLRNDFHNSEAVVRIPSLPHTITRSQLLRACKKLCGVSTCTCGDIRGPQDVGAERVQDAEGRDTIRLSERSE